MLRAVILDCDGVVVDSEPAHYEIFRDLLAGEGLSLSKDEYFHGIPAADDSEFFRVAFERAGRELSDRDLAALTTAKSEAFAERVPELPILPGTVEFAGRALDAGLRVGVASGGLAREVRTALVRAGLLDRVHAVVSSEDVTRGKPHPEPFLRTLGIMDGDLPASRCLVVEDAPIGIEAGLAAGMWVAALTTSYATERLARAHVVLPDLAGVTVGEIESRLSRPEARR